MLCSHHTATLEQHNSSTKWSLLPHNTTVQGRIPQNIHRLPGATPWGHARAQLACWGSVGAVAPPLAPSSSLRLLQCLHAPKAAYVYTSCKARGVAEAQLHMGQQWGMSKLPTHHNLFATTTNIVAPIAFAWSSTQWSGC